MVIEHVIVSFMVGKKTIIYQHNVAIKMMTFKKKIGSKEGGVDFQSARCLLGSCSAIMFQDRLRANRCRDPC